MNTSPRIVFFGGEPLAVPTLEALKDAGITPGLIVCNPDRPQGRKLLVTPPPTKLWAQKENISVLQPISYKNKDDFPILTDTVWDLFVVVAYNFILPEWILELPKYGVINVHPSLLPKFRGASPIRSLILADERTTGVTVMLMDAEMDHGPILAQKQIEIAKENWPISGSVLDSLLAQEGGTLLADTIPKLLTNNLTPQEQNHAEATYCKKLTKEMGELDLSGDPYQNLLKIRAFDGWPGTFFFAERNGIRTRIKIVDTELSKDGSLNITRIIPEGKNEMSYHDFLKWT